MHRTTTFRQVSLTPSPGRDPNCRTSPCSPSESRRFTSPAPGNSNRREEFSPACPNIFLLLVVNSTIVCYCRRLFFHLVFSGSSGRREASTRSVRQAAQRPKLLSPTDRVTSRNKRRLILQQGGWCRCMRTFAAGSTGSGLSCSPC